MTSTKLGDELLRHADGNSPRPDLDAIIRRQRKRVRAWAVASALLWVLAAVYLFALLWFYAVFLHPIINEFFTTDHVDPSAMQPRMALVAKLLLASLYWPGLLFLAAACTLCFTLASRRATLHQIQASLADISAQLKELGSSRS